MKYGMVHGQTFCKPLWIILHFEKMLLKSQKFWVIEFCGLCMASILPHPHVVPSKPKAMWLNSFLLVCTGVRIAHYLRPSTISCWNIPSVNCRTVASAAQGVARSCLKGFFLFLKSQVNNLDPENHILLSHLSVSLREPAQNPVQLTLSLIGIQPSHFKGLI